MSDFASVLFDVLAWVMAGIVFLMLAAGDEIAAAIRRFFNSLFR